MRCTLTRGSVRTPAVEARTIAWRYEVVVRRRSRRGLAETAARTPLLHEESPAWARGLSGRDR
jgi:hypothetical protein